MKQDDTVVGGQPEVRFDPRATLESGSEGDETVLGKRGAGMQAPVRKADRTRV